MKRREFIKLLGGAAVAWPVAGSAQQAERIRRIGVLMASAENNPQYQTYVAVFREAFQTLGWDEEVTFLEFFWRSATMASTARSTPRLRSIGFIPAATALAPSLTIA
jgi:hypothetical protein